MSSAMTINDETDAWFTADQREWASDAFFREVNGLDLIPFREGGVWDLLDGRTRRGERFPRLRATNFALKSITAHRLRESGKSVADIAGQLETSPAVIGRMLAYYEEQMKALDAIEKPSPWEKIAKLVGLRRDAGKSVSGTENKR
jgi:hypothetical protein